MKSRQRPKILSLCARVELGVKRPGYRRSPLRTNDARTSNVSTFEILLFLHPDVKQRLGVLPERIVKVAISIRFSAPTPPSSLQPTRPHQILLMLIPRKIPLPHPPLHRQPIPPIFRPRRAQVPQFVELLLLPRRNSNRLRQNNMRGCRFSSEGNGLPPRCALRIVAVGRLTAAEITAEKDAEGWCGSTHDADLELELRPDEEHEGGADDVAGVACHCNEKSATVDLCP